MSTLHTAEVAVFAGVRGPARTFTYGVPDGLALEPGHLVRVALGPRAAAGVVVAVDVPAPAAELRPIEALAQPVPVLRPYQLELARWIARRYRCPLADAVRAMVPPGLARRARVPVRTRARARRIPAELTLAEDDGVRDAEATAAQRWALDEIGRALEGQGGAFLLHGVTGSGKTEVYLRAAAAALAHGRGVIALVPEIALTTQVVARFVARFGERVALLHSALSEGERLDEWRRVQEGAADVVVGSRSALFAPLARPGLVVVDEEQEPSYKQESDPRYHAVDAAIELGRICGAAVVLGSATPRVTTYAAAQAGEIRALPLPERVSDLRLPPTTIVDLRLELRAGNRATLSSALRAALTKSVAKGEQAILYLNRRGYATVVLCRDCGFVVPCPACEIPYAVHAAGPSGGASGRMVCHRCGRTEASAPERCPSCGGARIRQLGVGTQRVEDDVRAVVPGARILRLDRDAVRRKGAHAAAFELMRSGRAQVIVGTQMVAKGFDLPGVTLVGVVNADTILNLPDHTSAERTFQLLTQVLGRSGRGSAGGRGILQTYLPDHYAVRAAAAHDYVAFAEAELAARRRFGHPPFGRLVLLQTAAKQQATVERRADALARALREAGTGDADVLGPAPAFAAKKAGTYRAQIVLRGSRPDALLDRVAIGAEWSIDVDPVTLLG